MHESILLPYVLVLASIASHVDYIYIYAINLLELIGSK